MKRSSPPSIDAVVAGYLGVDLAPGFPPARRRVAAEDLFRPGKLVETCGLNWSLGGVVANTGLALHKFDRRVTLMGWVGTDTLGDAALNLLRSQGVKRGIRRTKRAGTAYGVVLAPPGIDRIFFEDPGCNASFDASAIDYEIVGKSRLFHFGYPPLMPRFWANGGRELRTMLARVRRLGVATSVDMSLPDPDSPAGQADWRAILSAMLPHVDVFVPSVEELFFLLEPQRFKRLVRAHPGRDLVDAIPDDVIVRLSDVVLASGVSVLLVKRGHRGALVRTGDVAALNSRLAGDLSVSNWSHRSFWISAAPIDPRRVRNACGAGDCAVAGFLAAMLAGETIERAARYAMTAGRDNLYGVDACSGLDDWRTMTRALNRHPHQPAIRPSLATTTRSG